MNSAFGAGRQIVQPGIAVPSEVGPADVVFHRPFESHLDRFNRSQVEVLNLPLPANWNGPVLGRIADHDAVVRLAERDIREAVSLLTAAVVERMPVVEDWPDSLAAELLRNPNLSLTGWSEQAGLHLGSLSRGFPQQFGITPARFRLVARTHRAIRQYTALQLSEAAVESGFADQAHMSRATKQVTGPSPARLRERLRAASDPSA